MTTQKIKYSVFFCLAVFCFFLNGCAFHPRSAAGFPKTLNPLYFSSEKPNDTLSQQLIDLFSSLSVRLAKNKSAARFTLLVSHDYFSYSRPDIVNSILPTTLNFIQNVTIQLRDNKTNTVIATRNFTTSQSLTLNPNQVYTTNANDLIQHELNRQIVSVIYYWLTSKNIKESLQHALSTKARHIR